ncbi:17498_t:CDS:2 [Gigaspora rosea]|nr:17498_t:CDS:2 [Gigaspora rosea]
MSRTTHNVTIRALQDENERLKKEISKLTTALKQANLELFKL